MQVTSLLRSLGAAALAVTAIAAHADVRDRLYDFNDAYYFANGINPNLIINRRQATPPNAVQDAPVQWFQRDVRVLRTSTAYDHSGNIWFFAVMGGVNSSVFTQDAAGQRARQIANSYIEYVFPKVGANPVGLGNARQSVVLDMRNGYFSNDPLGLWRHVWVNWTTKATSTRDGAKALRDLASHNGVAADGTPLIRSVSEIDNLFAKGFVTKTVVAESDPTCYAICPVLRDPTDGGIALDQFMAPVLRPDGSQAEPWFFQAFESLRLSGDWP